MDGRNDSLRVSNGSPAQSSIVGHRHQNTTPQLNESFSDDEDGDPSQNVMTDSMVIGEDMGCIQKADLSLESENESKPTSLHINKPITHEMRREHYRG